MKQLSFIKVQNQAPEEQGAQHQCKERRRKHQSHLRQQHPQKKPKTDRPDSKPLTPKKGEKTACTTNISRPKQKPPTGTEPPHRNIHYCYTTAAVTKTNPCNINHIHTAKQ